jgi:hypothetical protein
MSGGVTDPIALLNDLLDRHERGAGARTATARIDEAQFRSVADWDGFLAVLMDIERKGGIQLLRVKREGVEYIRTVRLQNASAVYLALGRVPAATNAAAAIASIQSSSRDAAFEPVIAQIEAAWARRRTLFGLAPGQSQRLGHAVRLAAALAARSLQPDALQIDFRSFSRGATGDSKALADTIQAVAALLKASDPARLGELDAEGVVALHGVERLPSPVLVSGAIAFDGVVLPAAPYIGFPADVTHRLTLAARPSYLLTIENYASFVRHARERTPIDACAVLYTGGFPSRAVLSLLMRLVEKSDAPVFHWGDIDPGGLRIFRTLESALRCGGCTLRPHLMTSELLLAHGRADPQRRRLTAGTASGSAISLLWDDMARMEKLYELEQEGLTPISPLDAGPAPLG